jgi:hypothetical protein
MLGNPSIRPLVLAGLSEERSADVCRGKDL